MSDTIDDYRAIKDHRKRLRAQYGINCPECAKRRPRAFPTLLLPGQQCRLDGYTDPRPELTEQQLSEA